MKTIQVFKHHVYPEAIQNVTEVLKSGWTGLGPKTEELERTVAEYLDTPFAIGFSSGTAALEAAVICLGAKAGDMIITTPLTFISTNQVIVRSGLFPVFADIEYDTGNISVDSVKKLLDNPFIKSRTKAIMVVHYGGQPVDMDGIYDLANASGVDVIEDAAHAFGATYDGDKIGTKFSRFVCFSFHAVKPFAIGEGGMLTTYAPEVNQGARVLRWCGIDKSTADRFNKSGYKWDYDVKLVGEKSHMSDIHASIGLGQFLHYEEDKQKRKDLVARYRERLEPNDRFMPLNIREGRESANHLFVITAINKEMRDGLMADLAEHDIQTSVHYRPNHLYKPYRNYETDGGCMTALNFFERIVTLPLHVELELDDIDYICDVIDKYTRKI